MASYQTVTNSQRLKLNWDDPTAWVGGVVPNGSDADVLLTSANGATGNPAAVVTIQSGESYVARTIATTGGRLAVDGTLTDTSVITADMTLAGGVINANTLDASIIGSGAITATGQVLVPNTDGPDIDGYSSQGYLESSGGALSLTAVRLDNAGLIFANGAPLSITVTGGAGAFSQLSGATLLASGSNLFSGVYQAANGGTLSLNVGGVIANDGATIILGSTGESATSAADSIQTYDPVSAQYKPLQATLQVVSGLLGIDGSQSFAAINPLTVSGSVQLYNGGTIGSPSLTVLAGGMLTGSGTVNGPVTDNGAILVNSDSTNTNGLGRLNLTGPVSGSGQLIIGSGSGQPGLSLELGGATSVPVIFQDSRGTLQLDSPATFTGTIQAAPTGTLGAAISNDQVILEGITLAPVTGASYAGTGSGGTLTLREGATQQTLAFAGAYTTASFALSAGPQTSGASLDITVTPLPAAPTLGLQSNFIPVTGLITNTNALPVAGAIVTGSAVAVTTGNGTPVPATGLSYSSGGYSGTISPALSPGLQQAAVMVAATNTAGSVQGTTALNVDLLPAPVNGVTTAAVSSFDVKTLLTQGYAFNFTGGTQAVQLTNGTLSEGLGSTQALVQEMYLALLHRSADPSGLGNDVSQINHGASVASVAQAIINSPEANATALLASEPSSTFVLQMYNSFLGRSPTPSESSGFVTALNNGVSRGQVAATFATSPEAQGYAANPPNLYTNVWGLDPQGALITQLYQTALGRDPELSAVPAWEQQLSAGLTPQAFAQIVASSAEFQSDHNGQSPAAFVTSLYQSGLGRTPAAGEVQGWISQIQAGATPAAVTYGIATSAEAAGRLSPTV